MLIDSFQRQIRYLRVSVTDRCNYRCFYCMPEQGVNWEDRQQFLSLEEMHRLIRLFTELGVEKVRLTGGEPLVRRGLLDLIQSLSQLPQLNDLSISTNAHLLAERAQALKKAGINRLNISLDSIRPERFQSITRNGDLNQVLKGIDAALKAGFDPIKINMVVMKGWNEDEIEPMLDFALDKGLDLRYIETMPIGEAGLNSSQHYYAANDILARLEKYLGARLMRTKSTKGGGPARYYQIQTGTVKIGVISALSQHFCDTCNRVRLTAKGDLVLCLGQTDRVSLKKPLREGAHDEELKMIIHQAILNKPFRHEFTPNQTKVALRHMSALGG